MVTLLFALLLIALTTAGQLFLKRAADAGGPRNPEFWIGNGLFVITVGISFSLMFDIDLKVFSAIMSLNYIAVMLASAHFFGERLGPAKVAGTLLVVAGAVVFVSPL